MKKPIQHYLWLMATCFLLGTGVLNAQTLTTVVAAGTFCDTEEITVSYTATGLTAAQGLGQDMYVEFSTAADFSAGVTRLNSTSTVQNGTFDVTVTPTNIPSSTAYYVRASTNAAFNGTRAANTIAIENPTISMPVEVTTGPYCPGDDFSLRVNTSGFIAPFDAFSIEFLQDGLMTTTETVVSTVTEVNGSNITINVTFPDLEEGAYSARVISDCQTSSATAVDIYTGLRIVSGPPADGSTLCPGETFDVEFKGSQPVNANNLYQIQLSDGTGDFSTPIVIGQVGSSATEGTIKVSIPYFDYMDGTGFQIRIVSTSPFGIGCTYDASYTLPEMLPFVAQPQDDLECLQSSATFSATPNASAANGTAAIPATSTYQWMQVCADPFQNITDTVGLAAPSTADVAVSGDNFYVATFSGLSISTDAGATWTTLSETGGNGLPSDIVSVVFYDETNDIFYAGTDQGLAKSSDATGSSFTVYDIGDGLLDNNINDVFADGDNIFVATSFGLSYSTDGGSNWTTAASLANTPITSVFATDAGLPTQTVYATTASGVFIARSGSFNFSLNTLDGATFASPVYKQSNDVFVDENGIVFVATQVGVVYSTNGGGTWNRIFNGLEAQAVQSVYAFDGMIFAGTNEGLGMTNIGADAFTVYQSETGLGDDFVAAVIVRDAGGDKEVIAATLGGLSLNTFTVNPVTSETGTALTIDPVTHAEAQCRYFLRVSRTVNGKVCVVDSDPVRLADIPPSLSATVTSSPRCDLPLGDATVSGLIPGVNYTLKWEYMDTPLPDSLITGDENGSFFLSLLDTGMYKVTVASLVSPFCTTDTVDVHITPPAPPEFGTFDMAQDFCAEDDISFVMPDIAANNQQYEWHLDEDATMDATPSLTTGNFTPAPKPTASTNYYVFIRDRGTQCFSDTVEVMFNVMPSPVIACATNTQPTDETSTDGSIDISGLEAGLTYAVSYVSPAGTDVSTTVTANGAGVGTLTGLVGGNYTNVNVTHPVTGCASNNVNCPLVPQSVLPQEDSFLGGPAFTVIQTMGTSSGYFQNSTPDLSCPNGSDNHYSSYSGGFANDGIAVGRIRDPKATINEDPTAPVLEESEVELRGWLQFNLLDMVPENAYIEKVEYLPISQNTFGNFICDVEMESSTGDLHFDVTRIDTVNYGPYLYGFDEDAHEDIFNQKYNDFVISKDETGPWIDLGAQAVVDAQQRLEEDGILQLGLSLSGEDFDIPQYQFHGIVFAAAEFHKLRITYHTLDFGDLAEFEFYTDLDGGVAGPSHRTDLVDIDPTVDGVDLQPAMYIGATPPDAEKDGIPSNDAMGDDNDGTDDEDLTVDNFVDPLTDAPSPVIAGEPIRLSVPVVNNIPVNANVYAFIDWNNDGDFEDDQEARLLIAAPSATTNVPTNINFDYLVPEIDQADTIAVRVRITTDEILDANGPANNGEVEDFRIALNGREFGDLPDATSGTGKNDFNTLASNNGARHGMPIVPKIYMGDRVDSETDGQPTADSKGDDTDIQANDEDGVIFLTPLAPGEEAMVSVFATNDSTVAATIYMFADWENDGILELVTTATVPAMTADFQETLTFTVPGTATFDEGNAYFRFRITSDADFAGAPSPDGLAKDGEVEDYLVPVFKIGNLVWTDQNNNGLQDDDEINLGLAGVQVVLRFGGVDENDGSYDAIFQETLTDPLVTNDPADAVADYILETTTDENGYYCFLGMIEGNYQLIAVDPEGMTPGLADYARNVREEDRDSDGQPLLQPWEYADADVRQTKTQIIYVQADSIGTDEEGILDQRNPQLQDPNSLVLFPDMRYEERVDFSYVPIGFGDLPDTYTTVEDGIGGGGALTAGLFPLSTVEVANAGEGPKHIMTSDLYLGNCVDAEVEGQPDTDAGFEFFPAADGLGDEPNVSPVSAGSCEDAGNGVKFMTPLIPGYEAIIDLDFYSALNNDGPDAYLQAYFDWNGDGDFYVNGDPAQGFDPNEQIIFTKLNGEAAPIEPNTNALELEMSDLIAPPMANLRSSAMMEAPIRLSFDVPEDAKFFDGNLLARFRIGFEPNLAPTGILPGDINFPGGIVPEGEVEDYFMKLSKVGNVVWEDRNYDGIQDELEPGIAGVQIELFYLGVDGIENDDPYEFSYTTTTDDMGRYYFCGLIGNVDPSGIETPTYVLVATDPGSMTPTIDLNEALPAMPSNCTRLDSDGNDEDLDDGITSVSFIITNPMALCEGELDPDGKLDQGDITIMDPDNIWPDMQIDETLDFGYTGMDFGDLPDADIDAAYQYLTKRQWLPTDPIQFGPRHAIQPKLFLGTGVDGELDGQPDEDAGSKAGGDDEGASEFAQGGGTDDENGIRLLSPMLPGEIAYLQVSYTSQDTAMGGGYEDRVSYLNAFIDFNGDGDIDDPEDVVTFTYQGIDMNNLVATNTDNPELPGGEDLTQVLAFMVPDTSITDFNDGIAFMRFRLSFQGNLGPNNNEFHQTTDPHVRTDLDYPRGEVEDYGIPVAKIGNLAWFDHNVNGHQDDPIEALYNMYQDDYGVDTLHLVLIWGGLDAATGTFDGVDYADWTETADNSIEDIRYNLTVAPAPVGTYEPSPVLRTNMEGLYSFRGLIPGNYSLVPLKYLQADSASFVEFWPKHRVLTIPNNPDATDFQDSDATPAIAFTINDGNPNDPEVCVNDLPENEDGQLDATEPNVPFFADIQWDQSLDFGWVDEPNIEANLNLTGVDFPESDTCGHFNVIMRLCVKNVTETPLDSLVMALDLRQAYGQAFVAGVKPQVSIVNSDLGSVDQTTEGAAAALTPFINPNYDGENDIQLLTGGDYATDFFLAGDSIVCLRIEFEINPEETDAYPWMSQAQVWARAVGFNFTDGGAGRTKTPLIDFFPESPRFGKPIQVYDLSDEIDDPQPPVGDGILFEGSVADRGQDDEYQLFPIPPSITGRDKYLDEDDKTIQNDECWINTDQFAGNDNINLTLDPNCNVALTADNILENHFPGCDFGPYPEGSYYRLIIQDAHTKETLWASTDRNGFNVSDYMDRDLIYKARSVAKHCNVTWGQLNFEDKTPPTVECPADTDTPVDGTLHLVCTDIDSVLNVARSWEDPEYAYFTGMATATDGCGEVYLDGVNDDIHVLANCALSAANDYKYAILTRTFYFRDEAGNTETCSQTINFHRPQIILPDCEVKVPYELTQGDTEVTPADLVNKYEIFEAVPFFLNASGDSIFLTGPEYCGFASSYENRDEFTEGQCTYKIIRVWKFFDWCYGTGNNYPDYLQLPADNNDCYAGLSWNENTTSFEQKIIIEDMFPPIVAIPDFDEDDFQGSGYKNGPAADPKASTPTFDAEDVYEFNTQPDDCTADFRVTKDMFEVSPTQGWCFDLGIEVRRPVLDNDERPTGEFTITTQDADVTVTGSCEDGYMVRGVPMPKDTFTHWFMRLRFYDDCGKDTLIYAPFRIVDEVMPVMACDDRAIITFENQNGTANITAEDMDEGSWDNCGKIEWLKVRRPVEDCAEGFQTLARYVDANNNGIVDIEDYIDENLNNRPDALEYFSLNDIDGSLMSPYLDKAPFFCCDADSVAVELWGEDKWGNRNYCWEYVELKDKPLISYDLPSEYTLPNDQDYLCTEHPGLVALLSQEGTYGTDSPVYQAAVQLLKGDIQVDGAGPCAGYDRQIVVTPDLSTCSEGMITVYWILSNEQSNLQTDTRKITLLNANDYCITFPADYRTNCGNGTEEDGIQFDELACDLIAVNQKDEIFTATTDSACYKIFRTYEVINWCEYDGESDPFVVERNWDGWFANRLDASANDQRLRWNDGAGNFWPGDPGDRSLSMRVISRGDKAGIYFDADCDPFNGTPDKPGDSHDPVEGYYWKMDYQPIGYFQYTQHIIVYDDIAPELTVGSQDVFEINNNDACTAKVELPISATDICTNDTTDVTIEVVLNGKDVSDQLADGIFTGTFAEGEHKLIIIANDGCGNSASATKEFRVIDAKAPAPILIDVLAVELMNSNDESTGGGMAVVPAAAFLASDIFDCNGQDNETLDENGNPRVTLYSINRLGETPNSEQQDITVNCLDAGRLIDVEVHAWDTEGNHDFALATMDVQDNMGVCDIEAGEGVIAGTVITESDETVNQVQIRLSGTPSSVFFTNSTGTFAFRDLPTGGDYSVIPEKDDFHGNGITTFDLILVQRHILGDKLLETPYQHIAADVNNSKSITISDLIELRRMVLNLQDRFRNNSSWRFVAKAYEFENAANPLQEAFPEVQNFNNLDGNEEANFMAIKIGDVNGSALTYTQPFAPEVFTLQAKTSTGADKLLAGQEYTIDFTAADLPVGYQFTLEVDQAEIIDLDYGLVGEDKFGVFTDEGMITTSWDAGQLTDIAANEKLFSLRIRPEVNTSLKKVLQLNSRYTAAEAYNEHNEIIDVALNVGELTAEASHELYQNKPNPFHGTTIISFRLAEAENTRIVLRDLAGRTIKVMDANYDAGYHEVKVEEGVLPAAGVYYYSLEAGDFTATKRMILLE